MRRLVIGAGFVLAAASFGSSSGGDSAPVRLVPGAQAATVRASAALLPCAERYARIAPRCTDGACRLQASDAWDICEATGFWPE